MARERFLACVALTTWAELAGFDAVVAAARDPERAPWYDILIDRKFSVDNTFAQLSLAVGDNDDLALEKDTWEQRTEAFRALVRIADIKNSTFAHAPSGHFQANAAWLTLAALAHNLTRATDRLTRPAQPARRGPRRVDMGKSWADQRTLPAQTTDQPPDHSNDPGTIAPESSRWIRAQWVQSPCRRPVPACIYYNRKKNDRNVTARSRGPRAVSGEAR
ncbi:hypothetical protein ACFZDK_46100 [Streptomyces sp. NPDC007901]|uniref:hypothetical protein n=1 Tax=Streptomyces sp. NPDC007901 TaxID=3364785 RepID=UPI0036E6715D